MSRNRNRSTEPAGTEQEPAGTVNTEQEPATVTEPAGTVSTEQEPAGTEQEPQEPATVSTEQEPAGTEQEPQEPAGTVTEPATEQEPAGAVFRSAYAAAIDSGRDGMGTVPAAQMAAVVSAYRALRGSERSTLPNALSSAAMAAAMDADPMDVFALGAVRSIGSALADAGTARTERATVATDPRADAADALAAMVGARTILLATWDESERDAIIAAADERVSDASDALADRVSAVLTAANGKRVKRAPSAPRPDGAVRAASGAIASHVRAVVLAAPAGAVLTVRDIHKSGSEHYAPGTCSSGAIKNAIARGGIDGVIATRSDSGALAASADTEPATEQEPATVSA